MQEINLYDLLKYYVRNWLMLLSAIFVGAIIGLVYTYFLQTPLYRSSATILVVGNNSSQDANINNNYTELFKSRRVLETVINDKGYAGEYPQLLTRTTASNDKDTDVIRVSIADPSAQKSEELLSASLESFRVEAAEIYGSDNIKIVDPANIPTSAYNVNAPLQIALSVIACVFVVIIMLFFIYDYQTYQVSPATTEQSVKKSNSNKNSKKKNTASNKAAKDKKSSPVAGKLQAVVSYIKKPLLKTEK